MNTKKYCCSWTDINLFLDCQSCFYNLKKFGIRRPGPNENSFKIPNAIDELWKAECDLMRRLEKPLRIMEINAIDAIPFVDDNQLVKKWREAIVFDDINRGITWRGNIDDIFIDSNKELIVVDFKSTSTRLGESIQDNKWHEISKLQVSFYAWILNEWLFQNQSDLKVGTTGYLIYSDVYRRPLDLSLGNKFYFKTLLFSCRNDFLKIEKILDDIQSCLGESSYGDVKQSMHCNFCKFATKTNYKINSSSLTRAIACQ